MNIIKHLLIFFFIIGGAKNVTAQNILLNAVTQNSGIVKINSVVFFEIVVSNTSATKALPAYKLRPQISFPTSLISIPDTGHILPKGWAITSNSNGVMWLTNGTDEIPNNESRTILIALKGEKIGGASSILVNLGFSNGIAPGSATGSATVGDNNADNSSTSSITVVKK
jgi:hypothetical protein